MAVGSGGSSEGLRCLTSAGTSQLALISVDPWAHIAYELMLDLP